MIKSSLTPPTVDQATVDHYVAKGRRERSRAVAEFFQALFSAKNEQKVPARRKAATRLTTA